MNASGDTAALGLTEQYLQKEEILRILTPLKNTENIASIQVGSLRLTTSYEDEKLSCNGSLI